MFSLRRTKWTIICFAFALSFCNKSRSSAISFSRSSTRGGSSAVLKNPDILEGKNGTSAAGDVKTTNDDDNNDVSDNGQDDTDAFVEAKFIAETNLPSDLGLFRLRAYRTAPSSNPFTGNEPCVIYAADKPPFGANGELRENVPVRVHDQCLTSEVFGSNR